MIIYNGKNSFKDFDIYVAKKDIPVPKRKETTETVPLMSGEWDFSYHDDVDEYETLPIKYDFDVIADSKQELNSLKTELIEWLHSRGDQRLYDSDFSLNEFYEVYRAQATWSEEEGLKGLLSVEFKCYPLRKADETTKIIELSEKEQSFELVNNSTRPIMPVLEVEGTALIIVGNDSFVATTGVYKSFVKLPKGTTTIKATGSGTLKITSWREVL